MPQFSIFSAYEQKISCFSDESISSFYDLLNQVSKMKTGIKHDENVHPKILEKIWDSINRNSVYNAWIYGSDGYKYTVSDGKSTEQQILNLNNVYDTIERYGRKDGVEIIWNETSYMRAGAIVHDRLYLLAAWFGNRSTDNSYSFIGANQSNVIRFANQMNDLLYLMGVMDYETFRKTHEMLKGYDNTKVRNAIGNILSYQGRVSKEAILKRIEKATEGKNYGETVWVSGENQGGE